MACYLIPRQCSDIYVRSRVNVRIKEGMVTPKICFSVVLPLDTLLLFFLEAGEHLNKNEPVTRCDINEIKHEVSTLHTNSLVF